MTAGALADLRFFAAGIPAPKGSKDYLGHRGGKPILAESARKTLVPWMNAVVAAACEAMAFGTRVDDDFNGFQTIPAGVPVTTTIVFLMPRTSRIPKRAVDVPHVVKPDRDKLERGVFDSLTKAGVIADDNQVFSGWSMKRYANPNERTGAWISVFTGPVAVDLTAVAA